MPSRSPSPPQRPPLAAQQSLGDQLSHLSWRSVGPINNAGRVSVVTGVPGDPLTYYVSGANGGIIKTTNGGTTFTPIFDNQGSISIGAIAVAPSDRNVVYVGTGEGNPRNNASVGDGMYKSIDGGDHWKRIGLEKSDKIARIVIDAKNPDIVYACVLGREWGPSEERGVYKTTDGGASWKRVLFLDQQTSCSDISADANNSNIVYAGMYTYRRWAWYLASGSGKTGVYKSVDGGATWDALSGPDVFRGLPRKAMDRIGVAVAPSDPNIVYVISETTDEGELWRSDDAGKSWTTVNRDPNINFRPFYYADIRVDPKNPNKIFSLSGSLYLSEDGGRNFRSIARGIHGDHQAMWIDPVDPRYVLSGSDGGWQLSRDGGQNFEVVNTFPFTQFYHINYDMQEPYHVCGGLQDNGTWCGPSNSLSGPGDPSGGLGERRRRRRLLRRPGDGQAVARLRRRAGRDDHHHRHAERGAQEHLPVSQSRRLGRRRDAWPQVPLQLELPDRPLAAGSGNGLLRRQRRLPLARLRAELGRDLARPHHQRSEEAAEFRRRDRHRQHRRRVPHHAPEHRPVAGRRQRDLDGVGRRAGARHARRRQVVEQRLRQRPRAQA